MTRSSDDDEYIAPAEAVRALVRVRYPDPWVEEITSYWFRHHWVGPLPDRGVREAGLGTLDPLYFDPTQISAKAAVNAAVKYLLADVSAGSVRLRGELNGRVRNIDEVCCHLGEFDIFDGTLTIPGGTARLIYRYVACHKPDVEQITPRMRDVDLTPEKHSYPYRLQMSNQRAASQHGFDSVEAYWAALRDGNIKEAVWVGDKIEMLTALELLAPDIPQKWPPPQDDLGEEPNDIAFASRADEHQSVKKQAALETYSKHQHDMRASTGRWATRVEDDKWARANGYATRHVRDELRRDFANTLSTVEQVEFRWPGPRKSNRN
jgi:hypothetical protein